MHLEGIVDGLVYCVYLVGILKEGERGTSQRVVIFWGVEGGV